MIQFTDLDPSTAVVYSHVADDGTNIHIHVNALLDWVAATKPEIFQTPIETKVIDMQRRANSISEDRLTRLLRSPMHLRTPVVFCQYEEPDGSKTILLVDGNHRYALHWIFKEPTILCHIVEPGQWAPFQISGMPDYTPEQLFAIPPVAKPR